MVVTSTFDDIAKHKPPVGAATTIIVIGPLKTAGHGLHRAVLHHFIMSEEGEMVAGDDYISDESSFYGMSRISHMYLYTVTGLQVSREGGTLELQKWPQNLPFK